LKLQKEFVKDVKMFSTGSSQDVISKNYKSIRLKPDQFTNYLTTEVGFASYEFIGMPNSSAKGNFFRRISVFSFRFVSS
jgi:hypothetical protein